LESNQFLSFEKNYFYGDLLEQTGSDFEESVLVLLEMLRIFFPAGNPIEVPSSHACFLGKPLDQPISLLKRVFSLFPVKVGNPKLLTEDFEMCLFNSYAQILKQQMRFVFQTILYRNFRSRRCLNITTKTLQQAVEKLAFGKSESSMVLGHLIAKLLQGEPKYWESVQLSEAQAKDAIKEGLRLWNKVNSITTILEKEKNSELLGQFQSAHQFLKRKMQEFPEFYKLLD
jgi:hypothetical protein